MASMDELLAALGVEEGAEPAAVPATSTAERPVGQVDGGGVSAGQGEFRLSRPFSGLREHWSRQAEAYGDAADENEDWLGAVNRWQKTINPVAGAFARVQLGRAGGMTYGAIPQLGGMSEAEVEDNLTRMVGINPDPAWMKEVVSGLPPAWTPAKKEMFAKANWMTRTAQQHEDWLDSDAGPGLGSRAVVGAYQNAPLMLEIGAGGILRRGALKGVEETFGRKVLGQGLHIAPFAAIEGPARYAELRQPTSALDESGMPRLVREGAGRGEALAKAGAYAVLDPLIEVSGGEVVGKGAGRFVNWATGGRTGRALGRLAELGYRVSDKIPRVTEGARRLFEAVGWHGFSLEGMGTEVLEEGLQSAVDAVGNLSNAYEEAGFSSLKPAAMRFWDELPEIVGTLAVMGATGRAGAMPGGIAQNRTVRQSLGVYRDAGYAVPDDAGLKAMSQTDRIQLLNGLRDVDALRRFGPDGMKWHELPVEQLEGMDPVERRGLLAQMQGGWYRKRGAELGMTGDEVETMMAMPEDDRRAALAEVQGTRLLEANGIDTRGMNAGAKARAVKDLVRDKVSEIAGVWSPGGNVEEHLNFLADVIRRQGGAAGPELEGRPWRGGVAPLERGAGTGEVAASMEGGAAPAGPGVLQKARGWLGARSELHAARRLEDVGRIPRERKDPWAHVTQVFQENPRTSITVALAAAGLDVDKLSHRSRAAELRKAAGQPLAVKNQYAASPQPSVPSPQSSVVSPQEEGTKGTEGTKGPIQTGTQAVQEIRQAAEPLSEGASGVLRSIPQGSELNVRELGRPGDVKGPLEELERLGLVERVTTAKGKPKAFVRLTDRGVQVQADEVRRKKGESPQSSVLSPQSSEGEGEGKPQGAQGTQKEPWEMTRKEYTTWGTETYWPQLRRLRTERQALADDPAYADEARELDERIAYLEDKLSVTTSVQEHRVAVEKALSEGKSVPADVLAEFPDLQERTEGTKISGTQETGKQKNETKSPEIAQKTGKTETEIQKTKDKEGGDRKAGEEEKRPSWTRLGEYFKEHPDGGIEEALKATGVDDNSGNRILAAKARESVRRKRGKETQPKAAPENEQKGGVGEQKGPKTEPDKGETETTGGQIGWERLLDFFRGKPDGGLEEALKATGIEDRPSNRILAGKARAFVRPPRGDADDRRVQDAIHGVVKRLFGERAHVRIVARRDQVPDAVRRKLEAFSGRKWDDLVLRAFYYRAKGQATGEVWFVAREIETGANAAGLDLEAYIAGKALHEYGVHLGLKRAMEELFGARAGTELGKLMRGVVESVGRDRILELVPQVYSGATDEALGEEYLAFLAEKMGEGKLTAEEQGVWARVIEFFRGLLAKLGKEKFTDAEIEAIVRMAVSKARMEGGAIEAQNAEEQDVDAGEEEKAAPVKPKKEKKVPKKEKPGKAPVLQEPHAPPEQKMLAVLKSEPRSADDLAAAAGVTTQEAMTALTLMELKGRVRQHSGKRFSLDVRVSDVELTATVSGQSDYVVTAKVGTEPAGFLTLVEYEGTLQFQNIEIVPEFRRKGIATQLIQKGLEFAREKGFDAETSNTTTDGTAFKEALVTRQIWPAPKEERNKALSASDLASLEHELSGVLNSGKSGAEMGREIRRIAQSRAVSVKYVQEVMEGVINSQAQYEIDTAGSPKAAFDRLVALYERQPLLSSRTSTSVENQAYSTPIPLAYAVSRSILADQGQRILEPTAGTGSLLINVGPVAVTANEIDATRRQVLERVLGAGLARITSEDATKGLPSTKGGYDKVLMNPPFGSTQETNFHGFQLSKLEHVIAAQALEEMAPDGQAVMILGAQMLKPGVIGQGAERRFMNYLYNRFNVVANFEVDGKLYERQGTKYPVRVIVLDGKKANPTMEHLSPEQVFRYNIWAEVWAQTEAARDAIAQRLEGVGVGGATDDRSSGGAETDPAGKSGGVSKPSGGDTGGTDSGDESGRPGVGKPGTSVSGAGGNAGLPGTGTKSGRRSGAGAKTGRKRTNPGKSAGAVAAGGEGGSGGGESDGPGGGGVGTGGTGGGLAAPGAGERGVTLPNREDFSALIKKRKEARGEKPSRPKPSQGSTGPQSSGAGGLDQIISGLSDLFRGGDDIRASMDSAPETPEEASWRVARERLEGAYQHFVRAGKTIEDFIDAVLGQFGDSAEDMLMRWYDQRSESQPPLRNPDDVDYVPGSGGPTLDTIVPKFLAGEAKEALDRLRGEVGDLDEFVVKELGYKSKEEMWAGLAAEQVDGVALALAAIRKGKGMIIGDQTGIGKGRQLAALIRWAKLNKVTPVFVTAEPNLFSNMYGDLLDTGTQVNPLLIGDSGKSAITDEDNEVLVKAPSTAQQRALMRSVIDGDWAAIPQDVVFTTYSQIRTDSQTFNRSFFDHLAASGKVLLILDEAHTAAGDGSMTNAYLSGGIIRKRDPQTNSMRAVAFPGLLRHANVIGVTYSSATYAKRPDNMGVYSRTDILTGIRDPHGLMDIMKRGGVALQRLISANLARIGQFVRREKSFAGIRYEQRIVGVDHETELVAQMDDVNTVLRDLVDFSNEFKIWAGHEPEFQSATNSQDRFLTSDFASVAHNHVSQLLLALKAREVAELAAAVARTGEKPVIALTNTMETVLQDLYPNAAEGDVVTPKYADSARRALSRMLRVTKKTVGGPDEVITVPPERLPESLKAHYDQILEMIDDLDLDIPLVPIDYIAGELRRAGFRVGEITGRELTVEYNEDGSATVHRRTIKERKHRNKTINDFNAGDLDVLIINAAGSTGLSIHASKKFKDQRMRHMIIAQPSLDINTYMQTLGRILRSGMLPGMARYTQVASPVETERRPMVVLKKKLRSLNANTTADSESQVDVSGKDIFNKYGDYVVAQYLDENPDIARAVNQQPRLDKNDEVDHDQVEELARKVFGRLALFSNAAQKRIFDEVYERYDEYEHSLRSMGLYDLDITVADDWDAVEQGSEVFERGTDNSAGMFTSDVVLKQYEVKDTRPIPEFDEVQKDYSRNLGGDEAAVAKVDKIAQDMRSRLRAWGNLDAEGRHSFVDRASKAISDTFDMIRPYLGIMMTLETANGEQYPAWITDVAYKAPTNPSTNPGLVSHLKVTFAVAAPMMQIRIRGAQLANRQFVVGEAPWNAKAEEVFSNARRANRRVSRQIFTGNVMRALEMTRRGQIVQFKDSTGGEMTGLVMPINWTTAQIPSDPRLELKTPRAALNYSGSHPGSRLKLGPLEFVSRSGSFQFITKGKNRATYLDQGLRAIVGDFEKWGTEMRTDWMDEMKALRAIQYLYRDGKNFFRTSTQDFDGVRAANGDRGGGGQIRASMEEAEGEPVFRRFQDIIDAYEEGESGGRNFVDTDVADALEQMAEERDLPKPLARVLKKYGKVFASDRFVYAGRSGLPEEVFEELLDRLREAAAAERDEDINASMEGGYDGYSMSNRARRAYEEGKKPASVLGKELGVSAAAVRRFLSPVEWHHTSKFYQQTDFYELPEEDEGGNAVDRDALVERMKAWDREQKAAKAGQEEIVFRAQVDWIEWGGTRNHPKANKFSEEAEVVERGDWFTITLDNGRTFRKRRGANGFSVRAKQAATNAVSIPERSSAGDNASTAVGGRVEDTTAGVAAQDDLRASMEDAKRWVGEQLWKAGDKLAPRTSPALRNQLKLGDSNAKLDLSWVDTFLRTPQRYLEKVPALRKLWDAAAEFKHQFRHELTQALFGVDEKHGENHLKSITDFEGQHRAEYKGVWSPYVVRRDMEAVGYYVKERGGVFEVFNPGGEVVGQADDDVVAWVTAYLRERDDALNGQDWVRTDKGVQRKAGRKFSEAGANALLAFRLINDRTWRHLWDLAERARVEYQDAGVAAPVVNVDGEEVSIFEAMRQMGDRRGYYMPRLRKGGRWILTAVKEGENPRLEIFDTRALRYARAVQLERQGWDVGKSVSTRPSEEAFLDAAVTALNDLMQNALEQVEKHQKENVVKDFKDLGFETTTVVYTRKDEGKEEHFIIRGYDRRWNELWKSFGGHYYDDGQTGQGKVWHFVAEGGGDTKPIQRALRRAIVNEQMQRLGTVDLFGRAVAQQLAVMLHSRGSRARKIGRTGDVGQDVWVGYEPDPLRAVTRATASIAGGTAKAEMAKRMVNAVMGVEQPWRQFLEERLPDDFKRLDIDEQRRIRHNLWEEYEAGLRARRIDSGTQPEAWREAQSFIRETLRNEEPMERVFGMVRGVAALKYLTGLAPGVVNLTSLGTTVPAVFHQEGKIPFATSLRLIGQMAARYSRLMVSAWRGNASGLGEEDQWLFGEINRRGWDEALMNREAMGVMAGELGRRWRKLVDLAMMGFVLTERLNRATTIAAGYYGLKEQLKGELSGEQREELLQRAKRLTDQAHAVYGKENLPSWMRGGELVRQAMRAAYMYRTYSHNLLQMMAEMGVGSKADRKALAYLVLSLPVHAGPKAFIGTAVVSMIAKMIIAALGGEPPDDPEEAYYGWVRDTFGEYAEWGARGGLAGLAGVDISGSVSMQGFDVPVTLGEFLNDPEKAEERLYARAGEAAVGPAGQLVFGYAAGGLADLTQGRILRGAEKLAPRLIASPMRAAREYLRGVETASGRPVFYGEERLRPSALAAVLRALSFNPMEVSARRTEQFAESQTFRQYETERGEVYDAIDRWARGRRSPEAWVDILADAEQYNRKVRRRGTGAPLILPGTIKARLKQQVEAPVEERRRNSGDDREMPELPDAYTAEGILTEEEG